MNKDTNDYRENAHANAKWISIWKRHMTDPIGPFFHLVLQQIGFPYAISTWIMTCVSSTSFAILVNGSLTTYFKSVHGNRQGFPLSSFLFIMAIEGIFPLFNKSESNGSLLGVKISNRLLISLITFVDDVIILGIGFEAQWSLIKELLNLFFSVTKRQAKILYPPQL